MQCVILAGATKSLSQAPPVPPSLLPVRNRPFLHYQLAWLAGQDIHDILLCVGPHGEDIERYAEDGRAWSVRLQYVSEGTERLGSGGLLRLAWDQRLLKPSFFALEGDVFVPAELAPVQDFFATRTEPILMVLAKAGHPGAPGQAALESHKVTRYLHQAPHRDLPYGSTGLFALRPEAVEQGIPPRTTYELADLCQKWSERGKISGFETSARSYSVAAPEGLKEFTDFVTAAAL